MASFEELTEQMANAMLAQQNSSTAAGNGTKNSTRPDLPPSFARHEGMTVDEVFRDLNKSPLFMTELEDNDDVAALQALAYEGTALENAAGFKERGNECFKVRGFVDAREFYTKGILVLAAEERKRGGDEEPGGRGGLGGGDQGAEEDARGHRDPENKALRGVADDIIKRAKVVDAKRKKDAERAATEKRREVLLQAAIQARGIPTRRTEKPPDMEDAGIALVPNPDDPRSELSFPTLLLYPVHFETDFIKGFNETHTLDDHLGYVFPLPWDREGVYTLTNVECYVETMEGGLLKMGRKVPLLKVLSTGKVEVVDEVVRIYVLPKKEAEAWVKKFKEQKAAMKR
uniref:Cns1/TTC4 wheel domain-containing protein n=1 Tax=Bionectria ochroleuca TaxID=29856 RepID=A0A0B7JLF1_BIOOC